MFVNSPNAVHCKALKIANNKCCTFRSNASQVHNNDGKYHKMPLKVHQFHTIDFSWFFLLLHEILFPSTVLPCTRWPMKM